MKQLINLQPAKTVPFSGGEVEIRKLSANAVKGIQDLQKTESEDQLAVIVLTIRKGVPSAADMTDEEILDFPLEDLASLSTSIVEFSGLANMGNVPKTAQD